MSLTAPRDDVRQITEAALVRLPEDGRKWEIVDGKPQVVPTNFKHDQIVMLLARLIGPSADQIGTLTGPQTGHWMSGGNLRSPDLGLTRYERIPEDTGRFGDVAPDLCVEVISPSEEKEDMARKVREYFASGAVQVWHLFSEEKRLIIFTSPDEFTQYEADDILNGGDLLPGFSARVADLFAVPERRR